MKRFASVLLILCLLTMSFASAELADSLVLIYDIGSDADNAVGSGVLLADGSILTADFGCSKYAVQFSDGLSDTAQQTPAEGGTILLAAASAPDDRITVQGTPLEAGPVRLIWADDAGTYEAKAIAETAITYLGVDAMLVSCTKAIQIGALVVDDNDVPAAIIAAAWSNTGSRYVAVPLSACRAAALPVPAVSWKAGVLTATWSTAGIDEDNDTKVTVACADLSNDYYTAVTPSLSVGTSRFIGIPGRTYFVTIVNEGDDPVSAQVLQSGRFTVFTVPEAEPYTEHEFVNADCYIGVLPASCGNTSSEVATRVDTVTQEMLSSETDALYLQVENTYSVTEEISCSLLMTMKNSVGNLAVESSGYVFMPELNQSDIWNACLTDLLNEYRSFIGDIQPGEYTISYYIDGAIGGTVAFTVSE